MQHQHIMHLRVRYYLVDRNQMIAKSRAEEQCVRRLMRTFMGVLASWLVVKSTDATPDQRREGGICIGYVRAKSRTRVGSTSS